MEYEYDVCIVGGFGHVGLPLSIAFASIGKNTCAYDISDKMIDKLEKGEMPFMEYDADNKLKEALKKGKLHFSTNKEVVGKSKDIIITIGTPTDTHLNPELKHLPAPKDDVRYRVGRSEKAKRLLGWEPKYDLNYIISDTVNFIRSNIDFKKVRK